MMVEIEIASYFGHKLLVRRGTDGKPLPWSKVPDINAIDQAVDFQTIEVPADPWTGAPELPADVANRYRN